MAIGIVDQRTVCSALALAAMAPSIHNSQPWRFVVGPTGLHLHADRNRWSPTSEGEGRDLALSCGAVLHHLRVALAASGLGSTVRRLPDPARPDHLATLELHPRAPDDGELDLAAAIYRRRTDRRPFSDREVPHGLLEELAGHAAEQGAVLRPVTSRLVEAVRMASVIQDSNGAFRAETGTTLWSDHADLLRDPDGAARPGGDGRNGRHDGAVVLVLATASDSALAQLRAGEALSAVLLHASDFGLASCSLRVGASREILQQELLGGSAVPQIVLRVGRPPAGDPLPPTPRRSIDDSIVRLPAG